MPNSVETYVDVNDDYTWSKAIITYDPNDLLVSEEVIYDDGRLYFAEYNSGVIASIKWKDGETVSPKYLWDSITVLYNVRGIIDTKQTIYDNGRRTETAYRNGFEKETNDFDESAGGEAYNWEWQTTRYNNAGYKVQETILYDSELKSESLFDLGSLYRINDTDTSADGSAFNWETKIKFYEPNGDLNNTITDYDNGIKKLVDYEDGQISKIVELDQSTNGALRSWESSRTIFTEYGDLKTKIIVYDTWSKITNEYTSNGDLLSSVIMYDNGLHVYRDSYFSDFRVTSKFDYSDDGALYDWTSVELTFDTSGGWNTATIYDSGVRIDSLHESDGTVSCIIGTDNSSDGSAKAWSYYEKFFNYITGELYYFSISYDDGYFVEKSFVDGKARIEFESVNTETGYYISEYFYDKTSYQKITNFSDHRVTTEEFYDTGESSKSELDSDLFNWLDRQTVYDSSNVLINKLVVYDNNDYNYVIYENGQISRSLFIDRNGSKDWYARERVYDEHGNQIDTIIYETADDVSITYEKLGTTDILVFDW